MSGLQKTALTLAVGIENQYDRMRYRLAIRLGGPAPMKIVAYRGYGTVDELILKGRVLKDKGDRPPAARETIWRNLLATYHRLSTDEIPYAQVSARYQEQEIPIQADEEGYFTARIKPDAPKPSKDTWQNISLELLSPRSPRQPKPVQATGEVLVPPETARFVVISDIDDTIVQTAATHLVRMAWHVFTGSAHTRLPFPGVAAFLRALYAGGPTNAMNPLFYVSSSPWNLYDLLSEFFHLQNIPIGPVLFLRDWGLTREEFFPLDNRRFKHQVIREIIQQYAYLPFILIGDSGQQDPEIYTGIAAEFPRRVLAVYIRNVSRNPARSKAIQALAEQVVKAGSTLILADDTLAMARHAAEHGWIDPASLSEIQTVKRTDETPPTPIEMAIDQATKKETPTVIVKPSSRQAEVRGAGKSRDIDNR